MVMYMMMLMYLVLAEQICYAAAAAVAEQVPRLASANTSTTCCCEHVRNTAAAQITLITPIADLYRWSWGRWRVSVVRCYCDSKH